MRALPPPVTPMTRPLQPPGGLRPRLESDVERRRLLSPPEDGRSDSRSSRKGPQGRPRSRPQSCRRDVHRGGRRRRAGFPRGPRSRRPRRTTRLSEVRRRPIRRTCPPGCFVRFWHPLVLERRRRATRRTGTSVPPDTRDSHGSSRSTCALSSDLRRPAGGRRRLCPLAIACLARASDHPAQLAHVAERRYMGAHRVPALSFDLHPDPRPCRRHGREETDIRGGPCRPGPRLSAGGTRHVDWRDDRCPSHSRRRRRRDALGVRDHPRRVPLGQKFGVPSAPRPRLRRSGAGSVSSCRPDHQGASTTTGCSGFR